MIYLIYSLLALGVIALLAGWIRSRRLQRQLERGEISELPTIRQVESMECCGQHAVCEKESLLAAVSKAIEYYDDEELDAFQGRSGADYTDEETEQFRDVFYTMKEQDVAGWMRSLQLREVELPAQLRDEVLMVVGEYKSSLMAASAHG